MEYACSLNLLFAVYYGDSDYPASGLDNLVAPLTEQPGSGGQDKFESTWLMSPLGPLVVVCLVVAGVAAMICFVVISRHIICIHRSHREPSGERTIHVHVYMEMVQSNSNQNTDVHCTIHWPLRGSHTRTKTEGVIII